MGTETDNNAKIKRFQIFCQYDISEGPTNEDAWVQLGDVDFIPVPMACVLKKVIIYNFCIWIYINC